MLILGLAMSAPYHYSLPDGESDSEPPGPESQPPSNNIGDIIYDGEEYLWMSTGDGLGKTNDDGISWNSYLPGKAFSGLKARYGWVWAAAAFDTSVEGSDESIPMGGGFWSSNDGGETWTHSIPLPETWPSDWIENEVSAGVVGYDVELVILTNDSFTTDTTIWIPAFYGGLLKSSDWGDSWINVFVDTSDHQQNPNSHYDHRFFSFVADTSTEPPTLWAGSAAGIHKSTNGGSIWESFTAQDIPEADSHAVISGNWIVSLSVQYRPGGNYLWAGTRATDNSGEFDGISYSPNGGETWVVIDSSIWAWNFAFAGDTVFAATPYGVLRSAEFTSNWDTLKIIDKVNGIWVSVPEIVSVEYARGILWAGTYQGLAYSEDRGDTWRLIQTYTEVEDQTYAFPSPFSPEHHGTALIVFPLAESGAVTITIYDFALDPLITIEENVIPDPRDTGINQGKIQWDGTNRKNEIVPNGVYYFEVKTRTDSYWGKIMILK